MICTQLENHRILVLLKSFFIDWSTDLVIASSKHFYIVLRGVKKTFVEIWSVYKSNAIIWSKFLVLKMANLYTVKYSTVS